MAAIADCNKAIKNMGSNDGADELKQLMKLTEKTVQNNKREHAYPRVHTSKTLNINKSITRSIFKDIPQVPRVPLTAVPRVDRTTRIEPHDLPPNNQMLAKNKACRRRHAQSRPTVINSAPISNTRSHTRTMTDAVSGSRPNTRSIKRIYQLTRATPAKRNKMTQPENAAAAEQSRDSRHLKQTTQKLNNLEIELHQAMAVMDEQTGQLLNYNQLMRDPKYKKNWRTSSANEFGRLANGVGGSTKNPTNTIRFIRRKDTPRSRRKDITYGSFVCNVRNEKAEKNRTRFFLEETE